MNLCLGMMVGHDLDFLALHLPIYAKRFDGFVFLTDQDGDDLKKLCDMVSTCCPRNTVYKQPFHQDWGDYYNRVISYAEQDKYDALIRLDPDECIFPNEIDAARGLLENHTILCFSRINYWKDRKHYTPGAFPDWQARAWRLNRGVRIVNKHHEGIDFPSLGFHEGDPMADTPRDVLRVPSLCIHHYGNVGRERVLERDLHYLNVAREQSGLLPLFQRPADRGFPTRHSIPYENPQPIDPVVCGLYAPFKE